MYIIYIVRVWAVLEVSVQQAAKAEHYHHQLEHVVQSILCVVTEGPEGETTECIDKDNEEDQRELAQRLDAQRKVPHHHEKHLAHHHDTVPKEELILEAQIDEAIAGLES